MADLALYDLDPIGIDDLPRHLRNCVALHGAARINLNAQQALRLARRIKDSKLSAADPVNEVDEISHSPTISELITWGILVSTMVYLWSLILGVSAR